MNHLVLINTDSREVLAEKPSATLAGACANLSGHQSIAEMSAAPKNFIFKQLCLQYLTYVKFLTCTII